MLQMTKTAASAELEAERGVCELRREWNALEGH